VALNMYEQDNYVGVRFVTLDPRRARTGPAERDESHVLAVYEQIDAVSGEVDIAGQAALEQLLGEVKRALANPGSRHATDVMRAIARYESVQAATWVGPSAPDDLDRRHHEDLDV